MFVETLQRAMRVIVNDNTLTKTFQKQAMTAEMIARYCNTELSKTEKVPPLPTNPSLKPISRASKLDSFVLPNSPSGFFTSSDP